MCLCYRNKTVIEIPIKLHQIHEIFKWISTYYYPKYKHAHCPYPTLRPLNFSKINLILFYMIVNVAPLNYLFILPVHEE